MAVKLDDVLSASVVEAIKNEIEKSRMAFYNIYSGNQAVSGTGITEILRISVDFDQVGFLVKQKLAQFHVAAFCTGLDNWDLRLFNLTDAILLAKINFSELTPTTKFVNFTLPDGTKDITFEHNRISGDGESLNIRHAYITWGISP